MTDLAKVGFSVDTNPLKSLSDQVDGTKTSVKSLNDELAKTKPAADQAASGLNNAAQGAQKFKDTSSAANDMAKALVEAAAQSGKAQSATSQLEQIVAKTGVSYAQANAALRDAVAAHQAAGGAAAVNASNVERLAGAAGGAIPPITGLAQAAAGGAGGIGLFGSAGLGAGLQLVSFAGAVAAAAVSITKAGDEVERSKSRFTAVTGSAAAGAKAFDQIKASANGTGVEFDSLAAAIERATQGQNKMTTGWPVIRVGMNDVGASITGLATMYDTLDKVMQNSGATAKEETAVQNALAAGIQKNGGLTADTFQQLRDLFPQVARAISNAFSQPDLDKFQKQLAQTPIPLQQLETQLLKIKPAVDGSFDPSKPKTWEQAIRNVTIAWDALKESIAATGVFSGVTSLLGNTSKELNEISKGFPDLGPTLNSNVTKPWSSMVDTIDDKNSLFGKSIEINIDAAIEKALAEIGMLPTQGLQALTSFVESSISLFAKWGSAAVSEAAQVAAALANAAGSAANAAGGMGGTEGMSLAAAQYNSPSGGSGAGGSASDYSFDSSQYINSDTFSYLDSGGATLSDDSNFVGNFATGGSFVVPGNGGTDSFAASMNLTPGETVDIHPPGSLTGAGSSVATGLVSQTATLSDHIDTARDVISSSIDDFRKSFEQAVKDNSTGAATSPTAAIAAAARSASSASTSSTTTSSSGGGVSATMGSSKKPKTQAEVNQPQLPMVGDDVGNVSGQATPVRIGSGKDTYVGPALNPDGSPIWHPYDNSYGWPATGNVGQPTAVSSYGTAMQSMGGAANNIVDPLRQAQADGSKSITDAVRDSTSSAKSIGDATATSFGSINQSLDQNVQGIGATKDAVSSGSSSIVSTLESVGQAIAGAVSSAMAGVSGAVASAAQNAAASSAYNATGGGDYGSSTASYDGGYDGSYDYGFDTGAGTIGGSGGGDGSVFDTGTTAFDDYSGLGAFSDTGYSGSSVMDVANQYMGGFASGGQFTVGGDGGTDTTPVSFHATKGEIVTITPPGLAPPPSPNGLSLGKNGNYGSFATGGQFIAMPDSSAPIVASPSWLADGAPVPAYGTGGRSNSVEEKNINIFLQNQQQAQDIVRSRAQIARAIYG